MDCTSLNNLLPLIALGEPLPDNADSAAVQRHLDACPECRRQLDELRATLTLLHDDATPHRPALTPDRRAALRQLRVPHRRGLSRWGAPLASAAVLGLIAWAGFHQFTRTPATRPAPKPTPQIAQADSVTHGRQLSAPPPMLFAQKSAPASALRAELRKDTNTPVSPANALAFAPAAPVPAPETAPEFARAQSAGIVGGAAKQEAPATASGLTRNPLLADHAAGETSRDHRLRRSAAPPAATPAAPHVAAAKTLSRSDAAWINVAEHPTAHLSLTLAAPEVAPGTVQQFIDAFDPPAAPSPVGGPSAAMSLTPELTPDPLASPAPPANPLRILKLTIRSTAALPPGAHDATLQLDLEPDAFTRYRVIGHPAAFLTPPAPPPAAARPIAASSQTAILVELQPAPNFVPAPGTAPETDTKKLLGLVWLRWTDTGGIHQIMLPLRSKIIQPAASPDVILTAAAARFAELQHEPAPRRAAALAPVLPALRDLATTNPRALRLIQLIGP